ncbi:MAG: rRNA maturation RNase YbeY [Clostridiales bacterium]|jgi:probable rRNA maturation factor|nr:rRNA maturation RNase YbeY [Clostridiales bacterium]
MSRHDPERSPHTVRITLMRGGLELHLPDTLRIRQCINTGLLCEGVTVPCSVDVSLTDDDGIRAINKAHRNIDEPTDVLSFPALSWCDGAGSMKPEDFDPDTGRLALGDIVINVRRAREQAASFGHSFSRECGYLTVHALMHLLGYDHADTEERRKLMREHEERVLSLMGLTRDSGN